MASRDGRGRERSVPFTDTIADGDSVQAILQKQDEIIVKFNALLEAVITEATSGAGGEAVVFAQRILTEITGEAVINDTSSTADVSATRAAADIEDVQLKN